jgi:hypothetical protein
MKHTTSPHKSSGAVGRRGFTHVRTITARAARCTLIVFGCLSLCLVATSQASASDFVASSGAASHSLTHALGAANKAGSARITVQFFSGSTTGKVVQDSSLHTGKQTVALKNEVASVLLVNGAAYITGNSKGLTSYFGLPSALVPAVKGHWVSLQSGDPAFQAAIANVTLPAAVANVTPSGTLVVGKRSKVDRQWVRSISGDAPGGGRLVLFVATDKQSLPVEAVESSGSGKTARGELVRFDHWGEKVQVAAPTGAIPLSALEAASSGSG